MRTAAKTSSAALTAPGSQHPHDPHGASNAHSRTWQLSADLIGILTVDGYFENANPAWTSVLGWSAAEVGQRRLFEFVHPDDVERTLAGFQVLLRGEPVLKFENRFRRKDGLYCDLSWVAVPEDGRFYCSARDISVEKETKRSLQTVREQLRQSQKMEAVGQLTSGLAHDFNNLLSSLSGSLEILERRIVHGDTDGLDRYIITAQSAVRRASSLTHRLLAFSRRRNIEPEVLDIGRVLDGVEQLVRRTMQSNIRLSIECADGLWPILLDENQFENALLNLCLNARDAMPDGGCLTIAAANVSLGARLAADHALPVGDYLSIAVKDTGTGMTPGVLEHIFDPFFTTKPVGTGTGLGLSMVYSFATQANGEVVAHSIVGLGTTVCIYLPRHLGEPPAAARRPFIRMLDAA